MTETLEELLARCRAGEDSAVTELVRRFQPWAQNLAAGLLDEDVLAEDAVQEAFIAALQGLERLRDPAAFPGWLGQIIRRCANRIAGKQRELLLTDAAILPSGEDTPGECVERDQLRQVVRDALRALPPSGRKTAELFYLQELSCMDIANELSVPIGTVKRRLHDARKRLRGMLLGYVDDQAPKEKEPQRERNLPF